MSTGEQVAPAGERKRRPGTFKPGADPRRDTRGRQRVTAEKREKARLARIALDRTVSDVMAELRLMTGVAIDRLRKLLDSKDEAVALRACQDLLSRVNGLPVATNVIAELNSGSTGTRVLTADDVREAARLYLLRQSAAQAIEAQGDTE